MVKDTYIKFVGPREGYSMASNKMKELGYNGTNCPVPFHSRFLTVYFTFFLLSSEKSEIQI